MTGYNSTELIYQIKKDSTEGKMLILCTSSGILYNPLNIDTL